jgi:hypothetical protein
VNLESLQRSFWAAMREPPVEAVPLASCFLGDARLTALERVFIYRRAYWARQVGVLEDEFKRLARRVGREPFRELATSYVHQHPSTEPRIEEVGRDLPAFLGAHPAPDVRRLADLATFEWAEVESLLAADPPTVTTSFSVSPEVFPRCTIELVPSLRVVGLATDPLAEPDGSATASRFGVWRHGFVVSHRRLERDEHEAAGAALTGASIAEVCAVFGGEPAAAVRASEVFTVWLRSGWIARFVPPPESGAA